MNQKENSSYQITPLFAIPLYKSTIPEIDLITKKKLMNFEYEIPEDDGAPITHQETDERFILNRPEFSKLKKNIQDKIDHFLYEILEVERSQRWEITTSWVNRAPPGGYHAMHWHSNSLISGVVYIETNPNSGAICFHKDRSHKNIFTETIRIDFINQNNLNSETLGFKPINNDILLFPSILNHSVSPNESDQDRYSLAFNVFPRGIVAGGGNSELTL
jgi:uncharacterized protein (TIGR02466 family)